MSALSHRIELRFGSFGRQAGRCPGGLLALLCRLWGQLPRGRSTSARALHGIRCSNRSDRHVALGHFDGKVTFAGEEAQGFAWKKARGPFPCSGVLARGRVHGRFARLRRSAPRLVAHADTRPWPGGRWRGHGPERHVRCNPPVRTGRYSPIDIATRALHCGCPVRGPHQGYHIGRACRLSRSVQPPATLRAQGAMRLPDGQRPRA
jgi:hypothetical protein